MKKPPADYIAAGLAKSPKTITKTDSDGRERDLRLASRAYDDNKLKLCLGDGKATPSEFATKPESNAILLELKREKKPSVSASRGCTLPLLRKFPRLPLGRMESLLPKYLTHEVELGRPVPIAAEDVQTPCRRSIS